MTMPVFFLLLIVVCGGMVGVLVVLETIFGRDK